MAERNNDPQQFTISGRRIFSKKCEKVVDLLANLGYNTLA